jgi:hypothetical protein
MRVESVSALKRIKHGHGRTALYPHEGTRTRALYDLFKANEGIPIGDLSLSVSDHNTLIRLQDFYGLDIRCIHRGGHQRGKSTWVLAGEWFGSRYVDYIAQRITERSRD